MNVHIQPKLIKDFAAVISSFEVYGITDLGVKTVVLGQMAILSFNVVDSVGIQEVAENLMKELDCTITLHYFPTFTNVHVCFE